MTLGLPARRLAAALLLGCAACAPAATGDSSRHVEARERLRSAMELARQELHDGAAAELRRYLEIVPDDPQAHFQLGRSLLQIARRDKASTAPAIDELRKAIALAPASTPIALQLAEALAEVGPAADRRAEVLRLYEGVIAREPDNYEARLLCARWLLSLGGPEDRALARTHLEATLDGAPDPWRGRAASLMEAPRGSKDATAPGTTY
jgi:cytochrome c-type biogenesis protein CcmH/NrfG